MDATPTVEPKASPALDDLSTSSLAISSWRTRCSSSP